MVRINLIHPKKLADQHLIAEYNEILMFLGYARKYSQDVDVPSKYVLGKGHIKFFKNKLIYIKKRHGLIKKEMKMRNFRTSKTVDLRSFPKYLRNDWTPAKSDYAVIIERISWKIREKPDYYRYYGKKMGKDFFIELLK